MDENFDEIKWTLKKYGQEHLLNGYDNLDEKKKKELLKQINNIDFELIKSLYENTKKTPEVENFEIQPIDYMDKEKLYDNYKEYHAIGVEAIKNRKLAAVTMAGGQGTRLGHKGPKGTFDIGLESHKSLFELLSDGLKEQGRKYGVTIPWFIMTSRENNNDTIEFFAKNRNFGYEKDKNLFFFIQEELPMVDMEGKILIGEDGLVKEAANGHGGIYEALVKNGMTKKMRELGVEWVFIGGVDNCLVKMVDPVLMGIAIDKKVTAAGKSVVKANPHERVGVFCKMNGHPKVIEYTELPEKMAEEVDSDGELKYGESHIMCNLYTIDAIEKISKETLMYHSAFKKNAYIDENGKEILWKLNQVEEAFDRKRFCYELKIKGLLCEAFAMILYGHRQELTKFVPANLQELERLEKMLNYLNMHFTEVISLQDLADQVHLSREVCCRLFKKMTGKTITGYLEEYRVNKSFSLVQSGQYSMTQITEMVGFSNPSRFASAFRKRFGCNPGEYNSVKY